MNKLGIIIIILFLFLFVFIRPTPVPIILAPNLTATNDTEINNDYAPADINMDNLSNRSDSELIKKEEELSDIYLTVIMTKEDIPYHERCGLTEEEFEFFARVVTAEDNGDHDDDYENQVAIACVVLNRVDSSKWPNTVTKVLQEKGQFATVKHGYCSTTACENSRKAIVDAYENRPLPLDVIYFNCNGFFNNLTPYAKISDNYFSYG